MKDNPSANAHFDVLLIFLILAVDLVEILVERLVSVCWLKDQQRTTPIMCQ